jgi:hypothetical protein
VFSKQCTGVSSATRAVFNTRCCKLQPAAGSAAAFRAGVRVMQQPNTLQQLHASN